MFKNLWTSLTTQAKATLVIGLIQVALIAILIVAAPEMLASAANVTLPAGDLVMVAAVFAVIGLIGTGISTLIINLISKWNSTVGWVLFVIFIALPAIGVTLLSAL
jgi:hypothetical protein